jgi:hypothetical protein
VGYGTALADEFRNLAQLHGSSRTDAPDSDVCHPGWTPLHRRLARDPRVTNPVTGLVPPPIGPGRPPFNDRMRVPTRIGIVIMFIGLGPMVPGAVVLIIASIESGQLSPLLSVGLLVAAFGLIVAGIVVISVASRRRVLDRLIWAQANRAQDQA